MSSPDQTYYNIKRLHVIFAVSAALLAAVTVWMFAEDHCRQWKTYQRTYRDRIEPRLTEQKPGWGERLLRLPFVDALGRPLAIEQIWLPELTIDYNFRQVARFDRCTTCHLGIDKTIADLKIGHGLPQPFCSHPRPNLFVGSSSPHPMAEFGCTICHAGQGSATDFKYASHSPNTPDDRRQWHRQYDWFRNQHWDQPMLPRRFSESSCLKCHHDVVDLEPSERFRDPPAAKLVAGYHLVRQNGCFGCHEISGFDMSGRRIGPDMRLEPSHSEAAIQLLGAEKDRPGTMRKVGPGLRDVATRLDADFLRRWTARPKAILPDTRMPQFFGLHNYMDEASRKDAKRFEAVELRAMAEYLAAVSQPVEPAAVPAEVTEEPSAARGKNLFVRQGCAACHRHDDVPRATSTFGRDLTGLGSKFTTPAAQAWLTDWIRDPSRHSPRTSMPDTLLEPAPLAAATAGEPSRMSDPAADIAAYLLESEAAWARSDGKLPRLVEADLNELALMYLGKTSTRREAETSLGSLTLEKKLRYVGRQTIGKRGCFACHDIPGFEDAQPIAPALSDWGRKQESLLAFEQVHRFLAKSPLAKQPDEQQGETAADREFYLQAVKGKRREGFLWQKLRGPRSFDYKQTENKGYNEWLTMGGFGFTHTEREAISTFVLGLVAQPPAPQYVHAPDRNRQAIVDGRKVLDRHGCAECHTLAMERWALEYDPQRWENPPELPCFDFVRPRFTPEEIENSLALDARGRGHAEVVGRPMVDPEGKLIDYEDDDGNPLYVFSLWEPALIHGRAWRVGGAQVPVSEQSIVKKWPARGGAFSRLLYPVVAEEAGTGWIEAWGRVPPPLMHEGAKVQPAWLFDYLLSPTKIRPSVGLRMPKHNLSAEEAGRLVDYFAATSGETFPYTPVPGSRMERSTDRMGQLNAAMQLLTDRKTFCAKCHLIGDFDPGGDTQTILAPNLERVGRRIRPEYLRRWLAEPKSVLPYTGMPVNFPPTGPPLGQDLLEGTSEQQIEAVADLLLSYEEFISLHRSIRAMIESAESE